MVLGCRHKKVAYLDTDVGQPEFTLPGCLSLHVLDEPITGMY
jgi:polynucleotide 5'-hydroxyl-kinase GRC3/NOL9